MSAKEWVLVVVGVIGCLKLLTDSILAIGRWVGKVESDPREPQPSAKPRVTLERLGWEIEQIAKDIRELRASFDGRYAELSTRVNSDHIELREMTKWRAGLLVELNEHFYSMAMIDRMAHESEVDRQSLHDRVKALENQP